MGGIGSGRQQQHPSITSFLQLDVRQLQRQGSLEPSVVGSCQWTKNGRVLARAFLSTKLSNLMIRYQAWDLRGESTEKTFVAAIVRTECHFGGSRPWLACPTCNRRTAILYGGDGRLCCRLCRRATYPIQMVPPVGRPLARAQRLRLQLGGTVDLDTAFPQKPKGMHSFTYTKLAIRALVAESQSNQAIATWVDSICPRTHG
jgi:hypothetical protein